MRRIAEERNVYYEYGTIVLDVHLECLFVDSSNWKFNLGH